MMHDGEGVQDPAMDPQTAPVTEPAPMEPMPAADESQPEAGAEAPAEEAAA